MKMRHLTKLLMFIAIIVSVFDGFTAKKSKEFVSSI